MSKSFIRSLIAVVIVMVILPVIYLFTPADWGMSLCVLSFLCINPVFSIGLGIYAGEQIRELWYMPLISTLMYLLTAWVIFGIETAFLIYAGFYLILAYPAMGIRWLVEKRKEKKFTL